MSLVTDGLLDNIKKKLAFDVKEYHVIGHGAHNENYLLETSEGRRLLRMYSNTQFKNAEKEYKVLRQLDGFLGPRAYYVDTSRTLSEYDYTVLEYIEGSVIKEFSDESLVEIASKLKKLHTIKIQNQQPMLSPISEWTRNNIKNNSKRLGEEVHSEIMVLWRRLMKLHQEIEPHLSEYDPTTLIHDDPILGNFIQTGDGIKLIDWELTHPNYFFMELGGFIEENGLTEEQERLFLDAYGFGSTPVEARILEFSKAYRVTAIVVWFIERIAQLREGEKVFIAADQSEYEKNLTAEIEHLRRLL
jgi:thiamine kinase-like enzyme